MPIIMRFTGNQIREVVKMVREILRMSIVGDQVSILIREAEGGMIRLSATGISRSIDGGSNYEYVIGR